MQIRKACDICKDLICTLELEDTLNTLAKSITRGLSAKGCSIELLNRRDHSLEVAAMYGMGKEFLDEEGPPDQKKLDADGMALRGEISSIDAQKNGIRRVLSVPLPSERGVIGIIRVYSAEPREFTPEETGQALFFASMGGMLAEKARVWDRMKALAETARAVSGTLSLDEVLDEIAQAAAKGFLFFDAKAASIWLADGEQKKRKLFLRASYGLSSKYTATGMVSLEDSPIDRECLKCNIVSIPDISLDSRVADRDALAAEGVSGLLSVPLAVKGSALGILKVYTPFPYEFTPEDIEFANGLSCQGAIAIENARLFEHIKREYEELQKDVWKWYDWGERFPKRL